VNKAQIDRLFAWLFFRAKSFSEAIGLMDQV